jgi:hypothetical protein
MKIKTKSLRVIPFSFQSAFESKQDYPSLRCGWTLGATSFFIDFPFIQGIITKSWGGIAN